VFTPAAGQVFNLDSTQSLMASWTLQEMLDEFTDAGLSVGQHLLARVLPLYQIHRLPPSANHTDAMAEVASLWALAPPTGLTAKDSEGLRWLFPALSV
jgi:hypothetical protein